MVNPEGIHKSCTTLLLRVWIFSKYVKLSGFNEFGLSKNLDAALNLDVVVPAISKEGDADFVNRSGCEIKSQD